MHLTAAYAQLGEMDKAAAAETQLLKLNQGFTIDSFWLHQAET
jgi:hypothetical protein